MDPDVKMASVGTLEKNNACLTAKIVRGEKSQWFY